MKENYRQINLKRCKYHRPALRTLPLLIEAWNQLLFVYTSMMDKYIISIRFGVTQSHCRNVPFSYICILTAPLSNPSLFNLRLHSVFSSNSNQICKFWNYNRSLVFVCIVYITDLSLVNVTCRILDPNFCRPTSSTNATCRKKSFLWKSVEIFYTLQMICYLNFKLERKSHNYPKGMNIISRILLISHKTLSWNIWCVLNIYTQIISKKWKNHLHQ